MLCACLLPAALIGGCRRGPAPVAGPPPPSTGAPGDLAPPPDPGATPPPPEVEPPPEAPAPAAHVVIEPGEQPPPPSRMPALAFRAPKANEAIPKDRVDRFLVKLDVADFPMGPGGPHIHLVLDDHPYTSIHDVAATVKLGDIAPGEPLAEGEHVLVAFPSAADHVAIKPHKGKTPLARVVFWVGKAGRAAPAAPRVVLSRPKGTYNGAAADRVLLDFYLLDAAIGPGAGAVRATVTPPAGAAATLVVTQWIPHWITGLPEGDSRVLLELLDARGAPVAGRHARAERVVTVNRAAAQGVDAALARPRRPAEGS